MLSLPASPPEPRDELILSVVVPTMEAARKEGLFRSWFLDVGLSNPKYPERHFISLCIEPHRAIPLDGLAEKLGARMEPHLSQAGVFIFNGIEAPNFERMAPRYGGPQAMRVFELFAPRQTLMLADLHRAWRQLPAERSRADVGLAALLFQLKPLATSDADMIQALTLWLKFFGQSKKNFTDEQMEEIHQKAISELEKRPELSQWLESAYQGRTECLGSVAMRYRTPFRRIGATLARMDSELLPGRPRQLILMHAYTHSMFLSLGIRNLAELILVAVLLEWLSKRKPAA